MPQRTLRLAKERLSALDSTDLHQVVGGASALHLHICAAITALTPRLNDISFEWCPTPTLPIEDCL